MTVLDVLEPLSDAVNLTVLMQLEDAQADGQPDLIVELIDLYLEDAPRRLANMSAANDESDSVSLRREAHALKGCSATMGAARLAGLCESIETIPLDISGQTFRDLLSEMSKEFERVRKRFEIEKQRRLEDHRGFAFVKTPTLQR